MSLPGPRRHLGLLVATTVLVGAATGAAAETSADGDRAGSAGGQGQVGLLVLTSDPDSRAFVGAFLAAHLGQVLESEGIALRPWRASAARLMDRGEGFACSASDDCVRSVARALA
ncbi:MAG TPA: hypothetical protein RMF84_04110, partial [Polyangiaceae bacterium LLY-WYZ-14_1]|nr:hypothetical protein [Polyangiaceae bacterium LLY-WYZ-14_1]